MGLSAREQVGSRRLLELLETADLLSLAGTVTKKKSTTCTRAGAIDAILQNSQSAYELLNRRKVLRDIIATYLKNEGVSIPQKITKAEVVLKTLAFWSELDSCMPTARVFTPSSIMQPQAASASDFSRSFYFHTVKPSTSTPIEYSSKIWTLGAPTSDLEYYVSHRIRSTPSPLQTDEGYTVTEGMKGTPQKSQSSPVSRQHKNKVSPPPPVYQSTHDEKSTREVVTSLSSPSLAGEYDVGHSVRSSKRSTCPLRIDEAYTVSEGVKGTPQKSPSSPVSGNVTYMTTRSMSQTARQSANVKSKTETAAAAPYTGVQQHKNKVSPPPPVYQSTHDEESTREVVTSLSSPSLAGEYDVGHSVRSSKRSTCPLRIDEGYTVSEGVKGTPQKSPSSPVSGNVTYMTTRSMSQTARQSANVKLKTETAAAAPYTGVMGEEGASRVWPVDCEKFTRDFCEWYYSLLNSQNASSGPHKKNWGPQHFLENAVLHLTYMSSRGKYKGGRSVSACLLALVQEDKFCFQPNITSRKVKCERSPKGVVVVVVYGTLFRNKSFVGTFDQVFEVVGNLRNNNWKIQFTDLKIINNS
ncbi:uncharacterized protein LOC120994584 isoform X2 [Bufo bufo]|uniref:uncharacterized protein LOC120994584 isoform X2 n=1 Tax=Bufo bufo TaxID=8384 RepID=UPI001ABE285C|nr:uncharacterized protein LOC120994584 isoform X2 [Bufo bufo]